MKCCIREAANIRWAALEEVKAKIIYEAEEQNDLLAGLKDATVLLFSRLIYGDTLGSVAFVLPSGDALNIYF